MEGDQATETEIEIAQKFSLCTVWCGISRVFIVYHSHSFNTKMKSPAIFISIKNGNDHGGFRSQRIAQPTAYSEAITTREESFK